MLQSDAGAGELPSSSGLADTVLIFVPPFMFRFPAMYQREKP